MVAPNSPSSAAPGTSTEQAEEILTKEQKIEKANTLLSTGKRNYVGEDFKTAVDLFSDACQLFVECYDELAPECYSAYYWYGKALLDFSRLQRGVFQTAMKGVPLDEESDDESPEAGSSEDKKDNFVEGEPLTEEQMDEVHDQVEAAFAENADNIEKGTFPKDDAEPATETKSDDNKPAEEKSKEAATESTEEKPTDKEGETESEKKEGENEEDKTEGEDGDGEEGEDDEEGGDDEETAEGDNSQDEVDDLQLAFECADIARKICEKQQLEDAPVTITHQLCDALQLLGEINVETGSDEAVTMALEDLKTCIELQMKHLPVERNNELAESYLLMSRAHKVRDEFEEASNMTDKAIEFVQTVIAHFSGIKEGEEDVVKKAAAEVTRLECLVTDLKQQQDDCKQSAEQAKLIREEAAAEQKNGTGLTVTDNGVVDDKTMPAETGDAANDINNMVRKKRPADEIIDKADEKEAEIKRLKADVQAATAAAENGTATNGHAATEQTA